MTEKMRESMDLYGGYLILLLTILLVGLGIFAVIRTSGLEKRIVYLEQCCDDVQGRLTDNGVSEERIREISQEAAKQYYEQISEQMKPEIESYVQQQIDDASHQITGIVETQIKELEESKTDKKSSTGTKKNSSGRSNASVRTDSSINTVTAESSRMQQVQVEPDPDDVHFKVGDGDDD